jgi:hypothetical protein
MGEGRRGETKTADAPPTMSQHLTEGLRSTRRRLESLVPKRKASSSPSLETHPTISKILTNHGVEMKRAGVVVNKRVGPLLISGS